MFKGYMKRIIALVMCISMFVTGMTLVSAEGAVTITKQPGNISVAEGKTAKVTIAASGEELTYNWYYKNAGASKFTRTSSFTGNTYSVTMNESRDGRQIYCLVVDGEGNTARTNTVTLSMASACVKITKQPSSVTVQEGATAKVSFTASGEGLKYTWYYKNAGASAFTKTGTFTGNTYTVAMDSARNGRQVYCVVTDKYGNSVKTNTVTISMGAKVKITTQPKSVTVQKGETANVTFKATGDGLSYAWYYREAGSSKFYKTSSFTSNWYSVSMTEARDGRQLYCVVTDKYGNRVQTDTVTIAMATELKITSQPKSVTVPEGETATVTFKAAGDGLSYAWYYREAGSSKFYKTSSFTSNRYSVSMTEARDGRQLYCVVTDKYGNRVQTNTVTIAMATELKITSQPKSVTVPEGEYAEVSLSAQGDGLSYAWYYREAGSSKFYKTSSFTSNRYSVPMTEARDGRQLYCVVTDKYGNSVQSSTVTISMELVDLGEPEELPEFEFDGENSSCPSFSPEADIPEKQPSHSDEEYPGAETGEGENSTDEDPFDWDEEPVVDGEWTDDDVIYVELGQSVQLNGEIWVEDGQLGIVSVSVHNGDNRALTCDYDGSTDYIDLSDEDAFCIDTAENSSFDAAGTYRIEMYAKAYGSDEAVHIGSRTLEVIEFDAAFDNSTKKITLGDTWLVEGVVSVSDNTTLGRITINAYAHSDSSQTDDFSGHGVDEVWLEYWGAYRIDTTKAPYNVPGTYTLNVWAKDVNGVGGSRPLAQMTLIVEEEPETETRILAGVPDMKQYDSRWSEVYINPANTNNLRTIGAVGCTLTCVAITESYRTGTTITPLQLRDQLSFSGNSLYWPTNYKTLTISSGFYTALDTQEGLQEIYDCINSGRPAIVCGNRSNGTSHWVVVYGYKDLDPDNMQASCFLIRDPGYSRTRLDQHFADCTIFRLVKTYK